MSLSDPVPQRLSDAERDEAVEALRAHFEAGRLAPDEFDQRMSGVLGARTAADGVRYFDDLPYPRPGWIDAARPTWATYPSGATVQPEPGSPADWRSSGALNQRGVVVPRSADPHTAVTPASPADRWLGALHGIIWPVAILWLIFGNGPWWIIIVAIVASAALEGAQGEKRKQAKRQPPPYDHPQLPH